MFFSSKRAFTYQNAHNETFTRIAGQLATIVEKGRLYQQLLELNKLKDKFLGMAAHDLRNPLSALRMYLDLFLDGSLGDVTGDQKQIMKDMQGATGTMLALINDLLDVTAIESGHLTLKRESVNLSSFLQELSATHRVHAQSKSISLTFALDESLTTVYLDRDRIRQVMANLISNAIKYSHPHTTITITSQRAGNEAKISVTDQGQGIPKGEMDKLFKEFSKLSVRPTAGEESTGLGLAIVKRMVEAHGGRIWVTSDVGVGSTFGFSLPL
jgi:signal transduction histidine kinase